MTDSAGAPSDASELDWRVTAIESGDAAVIRARGELDIATAPELDAAVRALDASVRRLELDLHQLTFMDSSGITLLLVHTRRAAAAGVVLTIVPPPPLVARVLGMAGVTRLLPLVRVTHPARTARRSRPYGG